MNFLRYCYHSITCSLFADDAKISLSYRNYSERNIIQLSLSNLYDWR